MTLSLWSSDVGLQVRYLIRELRSHVLHGMAKKKKKIKKINRKTLRLCVLEDLVIGLVPHLRDGAHYMGYTGAAWNRHFHARNKFDHQWRGLCLQPKACALRKQRMIYKQGATLAWQVKDE